MKKTVKAKLVNPVTVARMFDPPAATGLVAFQATDGTETLDLGMPRMPDEVDSIGSFVADKMPAKGRKRKTEVAAACANAAVGDAEEGGACEPEVEVPKKRAKPEPWFTLTGNKAEKQSQRQMLQSALAKPWYFTQGKWYAKWDEKILGYVEDVESFWKDHAKARFKALHFAARSFALLERAGNAFGEPAEISVDDDKTLSTFMRYRRRPGGEELFFMPEPTSDDCEHCGLAKSMRRTKCKCCASFLDWGSGRHQEDACKSVCICGAAFEVANFGKRHATSWTGDADQDAGVVVCSCVCRCKTEFDKARARAAREALAHELFQKYQDTRVSEETRLVLDVAEAANNEMRAALGKERAHLHAWDLDAWWAVTESPIKSAAKKTELLLFWNSKVDETLRFWPVGIRPRPCTRATRSSTCGKNKT